MGEGYQETWEITSQCHRGLLNGLKPLKKSSVAYFFAKFVVPILTSGGLAAVTSSFFAALYSAFGKYDVVHIHAEGPAFFSWLPKMFGKRVVVTIHGIDWQREKWQSGLGSKFIHQGEKKCCEICGRGHCSEQRRAGLFQGKICRDYRDGKVTKEELDKCSTCDMNCVINNGLSEASKEQLKHKTGEEIVDADIAQQMENK